MSYKPGRAGGVDVKGRIRIPFDEGGGEESEDEDDDDDMWLDYSNDGGGRVRSKPPKLRNVSIVQESGKKHTCKGRFPMTDVYWTVQAKIKNAWLQAPPAYFIEQNDGAKQYHVNLFLDDCLKNLKMDKIEAKDSVKACFDIYCSENLGEPLTFFNLEPILKSYVGSEKERCNIIRHPNSNNVGEWSPANHGEHVESAIFKSGLGCTVLRAVSHPKLVECLSKLLPNSFQDYLSKLHPSKIEVAETMAKSSPWEFCFRQILFTKLKLSGAEAFLSTYEKGGYLPVTPVREKDSLYIYEVLKLHAKKEGHMYMPFRMMTCSFHFQKLDYKITKMDRWHAALDYLEENKVIVREEFDQDVNLFLQHNWKAEVDTVKGFKTVLANYESEDDDMDLDLDSSDFDKIRGDRDQLRASQLISGHPIVVLSGMGGCGKTTVVTNLLKHICDRHEKKLAKQKEEELSQQLEKTDIRDDEGRVVDVECEGEEEAKANCSKQPSEVMSKDELSEDGDGEDENEGETSRIVESKEGRLRRELKEDLLKILKDKKDEDSEEMKSFKKQILLVAPTGKAARLLGCKARLPSATIHSVIMSWRIWMDDKDKQEDKEWTYSHVKILVMDECSLVSVRLFAAIVSILLEYANLSKLILLGDTKQLPSIEPGDFLRDIFRAFSKPGFGFSIELTENHRSESTLIVENAKRISNHVLPTFDPEHRFYFVELEEEGGDNERDQTITKLLHHNQDVQCHVQSQFVSFRNAHCKAINELCCKYYNNHSLQIKTGKSKEAGHFEPGDKICLGKNHRVINHEKFLEEYIVEIRHLLDNDKSKPSLKRTGKHDDQSSDSDMNRTRAGLSAAEVTSLFTGDEGDLDQTVSDLRQREVEAAALREERRARAVQRQREWKEKHKAGQASQDAGQKENKKSSSSSNEEKLCNGEVFFIMDEKLVQSPDGKTTKYLVLSDRDSTLPRVVCVTEKSLRKDCKMKHSWVRTIHTYQGSESDTVVYFLGPAIPQNWQHVYTAVTRGKKSVYVVGKRSQLSVAVTRRSFPRNSRLRERLNEMLIDQVEGVEVSGKSEHGEKNSGVGDPEQTLSQSFENSDDSWISSMPDPYFTQALNTGGELSGDAPKPTTFNHKKDDEKEIKAANHRDRSRPLLTLKHSKVLNLNRNREIKAVGSLVKEEVEEDFDITCFSDSDNEVDNHTDKRVPSFEYNTMEPAHNEPNPSSNSKTDIIPTHPQQNGATNISHTTPVKNNPSHSPVVSTSQTPKKTPPRPSSSFSSYQSPPKQSRLDDIVSVDTPFRDSFKSTLSLDPHDEDLEYDEDDEDPISSTPRDNARRKLL